MEIAMRERESRGTARRRPSRRSRRPLRRRRELQAGEKEKRGERERKTTSLVCAPRSGFTHDRPKGEDLGASFFSLHRARAPRGREDTSKRRTIAQSVATFSPVPSPSALTVCTLVCMPSYCAPARVYARPPTRTRASAAAYLII